MRNLRQKLITATLLSSGAWVACPMACLALPVGGQVVGGQAGIIAGSNQVTINQSSQRAVIDWSSFNVGSDESVRFNQPSASSIALNRIHDSNPSRIDGQLTANGQVWLINPNGVMFGKGASVNVGGLVATTANIDNDKFMAGDNNFNHPGNGNATVENDGQITIAQAGLAAFVAPSVVNQGTITAKLGKVTLASGDTFSLDLYGDGLLTVQASPAIQKQLVQNSGTITADGGTVTLTAAAANTVVNSLINMDGIISVDSVEGQTGTVSLTSADRTDMSGQIEAEGGSVETSGKTLNVTGTVIAKDWLLDPNNIIIQAAGSDTHVSGNPNFVSTNDSAIVTTGSIDTALNNGVSVTITTGSGGTNSQAGDIEVASNISKTAGGDASLTLQAFRNITVDTGVAITSTSGKLNVTLDADHTAIGSGSIYLASGSSITSNGGNIVLGGGANPLTTAAVGDGAAGPNDAWGQVSVYDDGIYLDHATLNAGGGNISLTGTQWSDPSSNAAGVLLHYATLQTNGNGTLTITGTGGIRAAHMKATAWSSGMLPPCKPMPGR